MNTKNQDQNTTHIVRGGSFANPIGLPDTGGLLRASPRTGATVTTLGFRTRRPCRQQKGTP